MTFKVNDQFCLIKDLVQRIVVSNYKDNPYINNKVIAKSSKIQILGLESQSFMNLGQSQSGLLEGLVRRVVLSKCEKPNSSNSSKFCPCKSRTKEKTS
jgi:hypothetical protein